MRILFAAGACVGLLLAVPSHAATAPPPAIDAVALAQARSLRAHALTDDGAYALVASLTSEVGPRLAGSPNDAQGVAWAVAKLKAAGFANVHTEPVKVAHWERGSLSVELTGADRRTLNAASLGGSVGTDGKPLEGEVVAVSDVEELAQFQRADIEGRIVYFYTRMPENLDGSGYRGTVTIRGRGPSEAAKLGALAVLIRSVGTVTDDLPHTGTTRYRDGVPKIPGIALSNRDADLLEARLAGGAPVRLSLTSTAQRLDPALSANVVGEIVGREPDAGTVLLGAHLDSWDLATGAQDDGAGVALITRAAQLIGGLERKPRRTLRVVLFANEEYGLDGAAAYAVAHAAEVDSIALAVEADLGAGKVWGLQSRVAPDRVPLVRAIAAELEPLGVRYFDNQTDGGADVGVLRDLGVPLFELEQDAVPYFRIHHTPGDTLAAIDKASMRQALASYATAVYLAADAGQGFGRAAPRIDAH